MIDAERGEVVLDSGRRIARDGCAAVTLSGERCDGRPVTVHVSHGTILVELADPRPMELAVDWLARVVGSPRERNPRGAVWALPWGFAYGRELSFSLVTAGHRPAVPSSDSEDRPCVDFRCCGCGALTALPYGAGVLEVGENRGGAPCRHCGVCAWVQAGSMTEYYRFSRREDVCEVGRHPAKDVRRFELVSEHTAEEAADARRRGLTLMTGLSIKACPEHVATLRGGFLGCRLRGE